MAAYSPAIAVPAIVVGIDVGGTNIDLSAFRAKDPTRPIATARHGITGDFNLELKYTVNFIQGLGGMGRLTGIGIAVPRVLEGNRLINSANLPHWVVQPIVERLTDQFGVPVVIGNDVEAQALGESFHGHGKSQDILQVALGTGIGSAFGLHSGRHIQVIAGEVGHTRVHPFKMLRCNCPQYDCLECYAGGAGIEKRYGKPARDLEDHEWDEVAGWIAFALQNAVTATPVPVVVFSGTIAEKQPQLLTKIENNLKRDMQVVTAPDVKFTALGRDLGTIGAAALLNR